MNKKFKRILSLVLVLCMLVGAVATLASCKQDTPADDGIADDYADKYAQTYDELSAKVYKAVLGEFYEAYMLAKAETNVSMKYALMAIAEAKLLESGVMLPLSSNGGMYAISRVAPNTVTSTLWGNDSYRYHNAIVCEEIIKSEDRADLKAMWAELKGTGTWEAEAREYLEGKGYTIKRTYNLGYTSDPQTWDVLATSMAADSEAIVNTYDGLLEYDSENNLVGALATDYAYNWNDPSWTEADGYKVVFNLREGAIWVDNQGTKVDDVTADDFVAGLQHMLDAEGGLEYLVQGVIVNADEYINGEVTDFAEVGVKALDDYTVEYTLCSKVTYFDTMVGYGVFAPMSRSFFESKGGAFGADYDPTDEDYVYGKTPDDIAYCGPYTVSSNTAESQIVFQKNESYWNVDNINLDTITWKFNDGQDVTKAYTDMKAGTIDGCSLNDSTIVSAKAEKPSSESDKTYFDAYHYVSSTDATSFMAFVNLYRHSYANFNDETHVVSPQSEAERIRARAAMTSKSFRLALAFATDRATYNAQVTGDDLKLTSLRNTYTPGTFVTLAEEVTVEINGEEVTYPAGTFYGKIIQDQLDADGVPIKAWDPDADGGIGSSDGFDGWYDADNAKEYMAEAVEELADMGITVDADHPIVIDLPVYAASTVYMNRGLAYKTSVETATEGLIKVNLVECADASQWYYAGYYPPTGYEGNYDMCDLSGWGPDYGDPSTYLDTMLPDYAGYMTKALGIF